MTRRLHGESGIAMVAAMLALMMMIMLGGVALQQAVSAIHHTGDETLTKRALQAADAGIDDATYAVARADIGNTLDIDVTDPTSAVSQNCVVSTGTLGGVDLTQLDLSTAAKDPSGNAWCPETTGGQTSDGATYSYRISQLVRAGAGGTCGSSGLVNLDRDVVAIGQAGGKTRRVEAHLNASLALLSGAAVQSGGTGDMTMTGLAKILGNAESNGNISGTGVISGNAIPGQSPKSVSSGIVVGGSKVASCEPFTIPEVDPGTSLTSNDITGSSFPQKCISALLIQLVSCSIPLNTGTVSYTAGTTSGATAGTGTLTVSGTGYVSLPAGTYSFCSIVLKGNAILAVPAGTNPTRIFLADPDKCRDTSGNVTSNAGTISVTESARIVNCHLPTQPESLQIYAAGNKSIPTTQTFAPSALSTTGLTNLCGLTASGLGVPMTLIAPHSTLELGSSASISGQVAADAVHMSGNAQVSPVNALINISRLGANPVLPLYKATNYRECSGIGFSGLPAANPAQGC